MKGFRWWGLLIAACHVISGLCDIWYAQEEQPDLDCGMENMQVIIPKHMKGDSRLKVLNKEGKMDVLRSDPSCSTWVTQKPDGSVVIETAYDGCYVTQTETDFVLTIGFSTRQDGKKKVTIRKEMRCSVGSYHDAPSPDQCAAISRSDRMSCRTSQDLCASFGCCYDATYPSTPCYFGNAVTARCTPDGLFSIAIPNTLTVPKLDLNSVRLLGNSGAECSPVDRNDAFLLYQFPVSSCGTKLKVTGEQAVYENELVAEKSVQLWNGISITRDTTFRLLVRCHFTVSGFLPLKVDVVTLPPPPPVSSEGPLRFEMRIGIDSQYSDYYRDSDYPVIKILREPVFVEVRILQKSDPNLILVLHECWATPHANPLHDIPWPILINGCPFTGDNYLSELVPVVRTSGINFLSHYSRFNLKTFTFVDPNTQQPLGGQVYIHCSASACVPSQRDNCVACSRRKRSTDLILNESETVLVSSEVPIYFENSLQEAQSDINGIYGVGSSWPEILINGAAVTMGIIGVLLLALTTWTFHRQRNYRSVLISKAPFVKDKTVHIRTISSQLVMS